MKLIDLIMNRGFDADKAIKIIRSGKVLVNHEVIFLPNTAIKPHDHIEIKQSSPWVSRGADKLLAAIKSFRLELTNQVILDIGASTGGFTEVCLTHHAKKVYALDVGTNQLAYKLRIDPRVVVYEKTHLNTINPHMFDELIDIVVCDVSFISLHHVFRALATIKHDRLKVVVLIKPQFEAHPANIDDGGVVQSVHHPAIIAKIIAEAKNSGFNCQQTIVSPLKGLKAKNIEYISYCEVSHE